MIQALNRLKRSIGFCLGFMWGFMLPAHAEFTVCPKPILQELLKTAQHEVPLCKPVPKQVQWLVLQSEPNQQQEQITHIYLFSLDMQQKLELIDHQQLKHKLLTQSRSLMSFANEFIDIGQKDLAIEVLWTQQQEQPQPYLQRYSSFILVKPKYLHVLLAPVERDRQMKEALDEIGSQRQHDIQGQWMVGKEKRMGLFDLNLSQTELIQDQLRNASGQMGTRQEEYRRVKRYRFDGLHYKPIF